MAAAITSQTGEQITLRYLREDLGRRHSRSKVWRDLVRQDIRRAVARVRAWREQQAERSLV